MDMKAVRRERLEQYLAAERAILAGAQSYQIGSRLLTRANLAEIRQGITSLSEEIAMEEPAANTRRQRVVFIE